ncbi:hypothetical protein GUITHDRAFT_139174 [Guillardia theta CCMP2712]|uniref:Uncharacterized protein n=1 Tax=Guillardia theta (strain CCMP2712) TaxID=905079 RepID=L1JAZ2_GUITC|nr:hypothetical protein GUITHDRAFT_139174 [Guillardia theta CCMP2712]EKX45260.1 hypothetical protein GUITHDRAFT_139174 [Guillardia theta CCMP2712]|eukprot:XP_005832240.1 hypothetical protein GUITHDRAFT_139174 [Guillardia theta CCMP2712]
MVDYRKWDKLMENIDDDEEEEEKREWISRWEIERKRLEREWAGEEVDQNEGNGSNGRQEGVGGSQRDMAILTLLWLETLTSRGDQQETAIEHVMRLPAVQRALNHPDVSMAEEMKTMESMLQAQASDAVGEDIPDKVWETLGMRNVGDASESAKMQRRARLVDIISSMEHISQSSCPNRGSLEATLDSLLSLPSMMVDTCDLSSYSYPWLLTFLSHASSQALCAGFGEASRVRGGSHCLPGRGPAVKDSSRLKPVACLLADSGREALSYIISQATSSLKLHHLSSYIISQATSSLKLHHLSSYIISQATSSLKLHHLSSYIISQATSSLKLHHLSSYIISQATSSLKLHHLSSYIISQATSSLLTCWFTCHVQSPSALVETFHPLHPAGEDKLHLQDPYFHSFTCHAQSLLVLDPFLLISKRKEEYEQKQQEYRELYRSPPHPLTGSDVFRLHLLESSGQSIAQICCLSLARPDVPEFGESIEVNDTMVVMKMKMEM